MLTPPLPLTPTRAHTHTHAQDRTLSGHLRFYPVQSGGWTEETTASASANFTMQQAAHSTFFVCSALWSARRFCFWHTLHHRLLFCSWLITADVNIFICESMAVAWMQAGKELKADRMQPAKAGLVHLLVWAEHVFAFAHVCVAAARGHLRASALSGCQELWGHRQREWRGHIRVSFRAPTHTPRLCRFFPPTTSTLTFPPSSPCYPLSLSSLLLSSSRSLRLAFSSWWRGESATRGGGGA